jgi:hypothetical protein
VPRESPGNRPIAKMNVPVLVPNSASRVAPQMRSGAAAGSRRLRLLLVERMSAMRWVPSAQCRLSNTQRSTTVCR